MTELQPRLWSDFDGTAVGLVSKTNPRNWSKYPLSGIEGYADFLRGVASTGVEIAGVVTRRPDIFIRRMATARSISKLGFGEFLPAVVHKGSEEAKGRFVAEQSRETTIGMLEDKPHKLGAVLLGAVSETTQHPEAPHHPIVLGVVKHGHSQEYIERLAAQANALASGGLTVAETGPITAIGLSIQSEQLSLEVVQLQPYSQYAGEIFGRTILDAAA